MKEKIRNFTFFLCCFLVFVFIFKNNQEVSKAIINGVNLFFSKVFVTLFPMFILNDVLIYLNLPIYFNKLFSNIFQKVFRISGNGAYVLFMSFLSGTPSSSYIIKNLYNDKLISKEEANFYLTFSYFANPLFLNLMLSYIFDKNCVIKIIIIHYISNIIIMFILRKKAPNISNSLLINTKNTFSSTIIMSIKRSMSTLLMILGTITFYSLVCFIVSSILPNILIFKVIITGFLEITNGLNALINLSLITILKEIIAIFIISFGGLSIHTQVKSVLEDTPIIYKYFLKGRIMQVIISIILIIITSII